MKITIVGGGNIGTQFAVHCAEKGHSVTVYTSKPDLYDGYLNIVDEASNITHEGKIKLATSSPEEAFRNADVIIITSPATQMGSISETIFNYSDSKTIIGVVPGNGGGECAFKKCIERGNIFFGVERVPAIARLVQKGKTVRSTGYRTELHVAAIPKQYAAKCADLIGSIFNIRTTIIPNFLNLSLTPSNPILHTTRLRILFGDWYTGKTYNHIPLFYEDWNDESSELLIACDEEVQSICQSLTEFDLQYVKSLRIHYESPTVEAMTKKISSILAFKGLKAPIVSVEGGQIPDLHSRYFTADFSFGLTIIKQIGAFAGAQTPNIDETLSWYQNISVEKSEFRFEDYGINNKSEFEVFYRR